ncbi:hypothetical protein [Marinomonas mediterranea]|jgi:hypothetical protein|uniref:Motility protein n=1 Tax=Marinomonas mediterranea (strain ATCC 700492 / JCM 21426 / NBRC 103028 / MMB-1) TaxID=717774 RepID=F2K3Q9_MARM1|nr:hypothetical protein [Marinomonas mediterranea]ADZ90158.1 hypothetical protein Marme_0883 [Marinomonas mediterranea MMB-1]WCN08222.1 hypothetical protein GV055_04465 [Marinomonas mediterranea]WCN12289.1 hypothetical protein GV054_04365 [Marinomonas mediterranea]WCN16361.1 hypothetical protein GV053_04470 [Marinomonas mediterranea MMB-1]
MSEVGSVAQSYGMEALSANLAKKQQVQEGSQTLKLLDSTAQSAPQASASSAPVGNVGQNINIRV